MKHSAFLLLVACLVFNISCAQQPKGAKEKQATVPTSDTSKVTKTNAEWKKELTPEQYQVTCEGSTEPAFTGKYWDHHEDGVYYCVRCGAPLFDSKAKFDSGTGWPSFTDPLQKTGIGEKTDVSFGMIRTEIVCNKCGAHLGHVFDDGPGASGMRYCVNSISLEFRGR